MDVGVWWSGDGERGCLCHYVIIVRQEGVRKVGEGGSGVKTEGVEGCVRECNDGECLSEVVEGGMEALDEWCENILEHIQGL